MLEKTRNFCFGIFKKNNKLGRLCVPGITLFATLSITAFSAYDFIKLLNTNKNNSAANINESYEISDVTSNITKLNLFGAAPIYNSALSEFANDVSRIKLKGVVSSNNEENESRAIITYEGSNEKMYRIGDYLPINAILSEVLKDRVIISRGEFSQSVMLIEKLNL